MFGRKKKDEADATVEETPRLPKGYTPAKGTPTPKRKQVENARRRPLIASGAHLTKEQKKILKAEQRARSEEIRNTEYQAMKTGDIAHMPWEHRGRERAWARDFLDARRTSAVGLMPLAIVLIIGLFAPRNYPVILNFFIIAAYVVMFIMFIDAIWLAVRTKRAVRYHFGEDRIPPRLQGQLTSRAMTPRRWRLPKPQVKAHEYPAGGTPAEYREAYRNNRAKAREEKKLQREVAREK